MHLGVGMFLLGFPIFRSEISQLKNSKAIESIQLYKISLLVRNVTIITVKSFRFVIGDKFIIYK